MTCLLCDINPAMREAWEKELERRPRLAALCSVVAGGITDLRVDAVVSPANSFGFMRGGVDGVYTRVFGEGVESGLQAIIRTLPAEELPDGLQEGDYIRLDISCDEEATRAAREEAEALLRDLQQH